MSATIGFSRSAAVEWIKIGVVFCERKKRCILMVYRREKQGNAPTTRHRQPICTKSELNFILFIVH